MPSFICHHDGWFFMWSTVVDAPTIHGMRRQEFEDHYVWRYGEESRTTLDARMERAIKNGTSALDGQSLEDLVSGNRAGPEETEVPFDKLMEMIKFTEGDE